MADLLERLTAALGDRYAFEREVGRGGMAVVFLAGDLKHHRQVAIKVLHPELTATLGAERFLNEIEIVAGLQHPHILPLYDSGEADGLLYYVMPYAEGESLHQRLDREKQLAVDESVRITVEVADGLDYAHRKGVVHRDIKPGNILLSARHAVIADFGIARAIEAAQMERVTSTGLGVGTPLYASPEQATAQEALDGRTDIYSLGCVLYEMLAGQPPLTGATPQMIQARRVSETPSPLHDLRDTVPPALDHVIARALARIPADRYATASQFGQALQAAVVGGTPAYEASLAATPVAASKQRFPAMRWLVPVIGLVAIAAIVAVSILLSADRSATRQARLLPVGADLGAQSIAVLPFTNNTGVDSLDWLGPGLANMLTTGLVELDALTVVGAQRLLDLLRQAGHEETERIPEDLALNIAAGSGAHLLAYSSFVKLGDDFRLDVQLIDSGNGTVVGAEHARGANLFILVDSVSAGLSTRVLGRTVMPTELTPVTQLTTGSLSAYREYQEGLVAGGRFLFEVAEEHYRRAVGLDSTFALAWLRLGMKELLFRDVQGASSSLRRAEEFSTHAPERDRLLIQGLLARVSREWDESTSYFEELIAKYPDDKEARYNLGVIYRWQDRLDDARRIQEEAVGLDPYYIPALNELANLTSLLGDEAAADSLSLRYIELEPDQPNPYDTRGEILEEFGRYEEAREMYREAVNRDPAFGWSLGRLLRTYVREGNPTGGREALQPFLTADQPEVVWWARRWEAHAYDAEGRYLDALEASLGTIESARELGRDDLLLWALPEAGAWANATGAYDEAEEIFTELNRLNPFRGLGILTTYGGQRRFDQMSRVRDAAAEAVETAPESMQGRVEAHVHYADGLIAWYRTGDADATARFFGEGRVIAGASGRTIWAVEEILALIAAGEAAEALAIIDTKEEWQRWVVGHTLAHETLYLRGRAYEALGETEKALGNYRRLLDVAGDGVREVVLFRDTPERVARLTGEP